MDNRAYSQEQQTLRMSVLYDAALLISSGVEYSDILTGLSRHLNAVLPVDRAWLLVSGSSGLQTAAVFPSRKDTTAVFDSDVLDAVLKQESSGRFSGDKELESLFSGAPAEGIGSVIVCPLQRGVQPEGYLLLASGEKNAYKKEDSILLFLLGLQLATVLRNIRLHRDLVDINSRLNLIFDSIEEGILLLDSDFRIQNFNPQVQSFFFKDNPPQQEEDFSAFLLQQKSRYQIGRWVALIKKIRDRSPAEFPFSFELISEEKNKPQAIFLEFLYVEKEGEKLGYLVILRDIGEMKKADDLRKDLTAMLVHDLRSPLGIINWNMEMILDGVTGEITPKQEKLLRGSIDNSRELLNMVDSLLDIDRLETGSLTLDMEKFSLKELVKNLVEHMEILSTQMELTFITDIGDDLPVVTADQSLIRRVLFNLLFNASKYSPPGSSVTISAVHDPEKDTITTSIIDQGPGVPSKYRNLIFDKYVQVQARSRGEVKSKGLGLTFCKLAVEAHNGSIWVESGEKSGAVFRFTISCSPSEVHP